MRWRYPREIREIKVASQKVTKPLRLAVAADLHDGEYDDILPVLAGCDAILIVGDLVDRHSGTYGNAVRFVNEAPDLAPIFYSLGNHEQKLKGLEDYWPHVKKSRVTVLDDRFVPFEGIVLGGLSSREKGLARTDFLRDMAREEGFRLLMCHHPEYYARHVQPFDIDLTIAGHAHGGQVRIGGQGLFAPGQGILPKLTSGFYYDDRLLVSRGLTNATWAPRVNCGCELMILCLEPDKAT